MHVGFFTEISVAALACVLVAIAMHDIHAAHFLDRDMPPILRCP